MNERSKTNRLLELGMAAGIGAMILFSLLAWVRDGDGTLAGVGAGVGFGIFLSCLVAALRRR